MSASVADRAAELAIEAVRGDADRADWSRYVARHPEGSAFHDPRWSLAVQRAFGHAPRHLIARQGGRVVGVLPLLEVQSLFGGRMLVSVPYATLGGMLCEEASVALAITAAAVQLADECNASVLELRSQTALAPALEPVEGYVGFRRSLPLRAADVPGFLPQHARAAARNAETRRGVVVQHDPAGLPLVWSLYARSMRRLGSINYPRAFFQALQAEFGGQVWVSVAREGERPICGAVTLVHGETVMPYVFGNDERVRCDGAANLLYRSIMERAVEQGYRMWDFGRSRADNRGAVGFKKNQGFDPQPLGYQRYVPAGRPRVNLRADSPQFSLARRLWPRLPLCVTKPLGGWLAKSLPG